MPRAVPYQVLAAVLSILAVSCSTPRKISRLRACPVSPVLSIAEDVRPVSLKEDTVTRDTLVVKGPEGQDVLIMRAVRDENGEMVATERLSAAVVTALFKNVAERHGKVDLRFRLTVPGELLDSRWQLRLRPSLHMLGETSPMDSVVVTGEQYRKAQLRGYQQYARFLESIITDTTVFLRKKDFEVFLSRNIPELYALKADSAFVSDERFSSIYGVTQKEAVMHYTDKFRVSVNNRRISMKERRYRKYVKVPIVREGLRLDTVIADAGGGMSYEYVQTVPTRPRLRKAQITVEGAIYEEDRELLKLSGADTLSFYISTLSSLVDPTERYLTKVIERRAEANSVCWIEFSSGSAEVCREMGKNSVEMERIEMNLRNLLQNRKYDLDSIVVTASASPEGTVSSNLLLSRKRSEAVCRCFGDFCRVFRDSVSMEEGVRMSLDGELQDNPKAGNIAFVPRAAGENWGTLTRMVETDGLLSEQDREDYRSVLAIADKDKRERALSGMPCYRYLREKVYPYLRTVRFDFHLHLKGMTRDTVHTTIPDTLYAAGVQAIRDRNYDRAVEILRPYADFNTAVAYSALDYNASALAVLQDVPVSARSNYLKAILFSRMGEDRDAVQCYLDACAADPSFVHRGNLDPEISALIKKYNLNQE